MNWKLARVRKKPFRQGEPIMGNMIQGMGPMRPMGGMPEPKPLTEEQKTALEEILEQYDPENLSADDARAMFKAFKEAGIRGPELREAIKEAGFDPERTWSLVHDGKQPPQRPEIGQGGGLNLSALKSLQSILNQFNLEDLSREEQNDLTELLDNAGLLRPGSMIDLSR